MNDLARALLGLAALLALSSCHRTAVDLSELEASCEAYCEQVFACFDPSSFFPSPTPDVQACTDRCASDPPDDLDCLEDEVTYSYCLADMSCEQLEIFNDDPWDARLDGLCEVELHEASVCE